ncbi:hypothetical protein ZE88_004713 [Salmonella enterica subsp. enterica]|nr:hypothetical protein [Salmonella enterica subsp. enterica]
MRISSNYSYIRPPLPERAENGFPAAPATPHGHAINCTPVHRFQLSNFLWIDRLITRYRMPRG